MHYGGTQFYLSIFCLILAVSCRFESFAQPVAQKGVINLSDIDFNIEKPVKLNGEWAFY